MRSLVRRLAIAAALLAVAPAWAQKQSLGERVSALEQKLAASSQGSSQANVDLLNRLTQLQAEVQALRNQVEQLQNENEQLKQRGREQYLDLDSRLQRFEGSGAPAAPAAAAAKPAASAVVPAKPAATTPAPAAAGNPADEAAAYGAAFDHLKRGDYVESARGFQGFVETHPQAALAPNAWYWLGESYYVTQNYELALDAFVHVLEQFPDSNKAADALLKKGYCQLEMRQNDAGRRTLEEVVDRYPNSDVSRLAISRLRALNLEPR
jgi:tol-pal system protein YbgF